MLLHHALNKPASAANDRSSIIPAAHGICPWRERGQPMEGYASALMHYCGFGPAPARWPGDVLPQPRCCWPGASGAGSGRSMDHSCWCSSYSSGERRTHPGPCSSWALLRAGSSPVGGRDTTRSTWPTASSCSTRRTHGCRAAPMAALVQVVAVLRHARQLHPPALLRWVPAA